MVNINKDNIRIIRLGRRVNRIRLRWWSRLCFYIHWFIYKYLLKGGVVYVDKNKTIAQAHKEVRKGGYIIIKAE